MNRKRKSFAAAFLVATLIAASSFVGSARGEEDGSSSLCHVPGCQCNPNEESADLIDVVCQCLENQKLDVGVSSPTGPDARLPPENSVQLKFSGCSELHFRPRLLNSLPQLKNVTVAKTEKLVVHARIYDSRTANGQSADLHTIEISEVSDLSVSRHSFEGISVSGVFWLKEVVVPKVPSLAFSFDNVREFSIYGSRFDRVSMWGFKPKKCSEFNALGMSRFFSLASQAISMRCDKFMLAYNMFAQLQDSAFDVEYGLADIQGNTFETLTGKPFLDLRPIAAAAAAVNAPISTPSSSDVQSGLVFRENKFSATPDLPFGSLAMPTFENIDVDGNSYVNIDDNHFVCECDKLAWFIGAMTNSFDRDALEKIESKKQAGTGTLAFLDELYDSSGSCLKCSLTKCDVIEGEDFMDYADTALIVDKGQLKCSATGKPIKTHGNGNGNHLGNGGGDKDRPSSYNYEKDDGTVDGYHNRREEEAGGSGGGQVGDVEHLASESDASSIHRVGQTAVIGIVVAFATRLLQT